MYICYMQARLHDLIEYCQVYRKKKHHSKKWLSPFFLYQVADLEEELNACAQELRRVLETRPSVRNAFSEAEEDAENLRRLEHLLYGTQF